MDCDDVVLLLAARRPVSDAERAELDAHCATCATCAAVRAEAEEQRWIARLPERALDERDLAVLPTIDPIVFARHDEIARGGMGRISRVRDRRLARDLALKEILDPTLRARFEREIRITATLQHPAIVPIYEAGVWPDGTAFYTMRLVRGRTLADAFADAVTLEARLALLPHVIAATEAVAHAHARRIVHRDLKPSNVLVGDFGETVVIDWGLAKELDGTPFDDGEALTRAGTVIGTAGYMPVEQARGEQVDERADVYALGAMLYHALSGRVPYLEPRATVASLLAATLAGPPTPLDELAPRTPAELRAIVERAMDREPERRYANAGELAGALRAFAAHRVLGRDRAAPRRRSITIAAEIALAAIAFAGVVASALLLSSRDHERAARVAAEEARRDGELRGESTEHAVDALLEERGRVELVAGSAERALPYLAAAYAHGRGGVALRHMLAAATRPRPAHADVWQLADATGAPAALAPDGVRRAIASSDGTIRIWDVDRARVIDAIATGAAVRELAWSADGAHLLVNGTPWDVHLEERAPAELTALVARGAWILDGAVLRRRQP